MILDRRPFIFVWRPVYRFVADRLIGGQYLRLRRLMLNDPLDGEAADGSAAAMLRALLRTSEETRAQVELLAKAVAGVEARQAEILARAEEMERRWGQVRESWAASETLWLSLLQNARRDGLDSKPADPE